MADRVARVRHSLIVIACAILVAAAACGEGRDRGVFDVADAAPPSGFDGGAPCVGLACKLATCPPNGETALRGKVYDPAGRTGLYNVQVYVPGGPYPEQLPPLDAGVSCATCASTVVGPLRATLTDVRGEFTLADVPADKELPLVIQIGKWRRLFKVDASRACNENVVPAQTLMMPKNGREGDLPQIAVVAGGCDALECLLRGAGVDDSEFVVGHGGNGHIHVFNGHGGRFPGGPVGTGLEAPVGKGSARDDLWNDAARMKAYDLTMLACECGEYNADKGGPGDKLGPVASTVRDYLEAGGRVFATHFHSTWFKSSAHEDFRAIADWKDGAADPTTELQRVEMSFPRGRAMAEWLFFNGASVKLGEVAVGNLSYSLDVARPPAQTWIKSPVRADGRELTRYFSFNTPLSAPPDKPCGRAVFGDLHLMGTGGLFPDECPSPGGLLPQQMVFEFMLFDLSACVEEASKTPQPPR